MNIIKKTLATAVCGMALMPLAASAQGWPEKYQGVMLQGFYWDSFDDTQWTQLESQADELSSYFKLVWIPQSAYCGGKSMGSPSTGLAITIRRSARRLSCAL